MNPGVLLLLGALIQGDLRQLVTEVAEDLAALGFVLDTNRLVLELNLARERQEAAVFVGASSNCALIEFQDTWILDGVVDVYAPPQEENRGDERTVAAYYDPTHERIAFISQRPEAEGGLPSEATVAHELVHAWRDQVSGLERPRHRCRSTDERMVLECLTEGEATFGAYGLNLQRRGSTPRRLSREFEENRPGRMYPLNTVDLTYDHGARFMLSEWRRGGWPAVRSAMDRRPSSTEQLMHGDKLGLDDPTEVTLPVLPDRFGKGDLLYTDTIGELRTFALLRLASVPQEQAWIAATGWEGDRFCVLDCGYGDEVRIWRTLWDREEDAQQFVQALSPTVDGSIAANGRIVDLVRSTNGALEETIVAWLQNAVCEYEPDLLDQETTELAEVEYLEARAMLPYEKSGNWVVPEHEVSLPILEHWHVRRWTDGTLYCRRDGDIVGASRVFRMDWLEGVSEADQLPRVLQDIDARRSRGGLIRAELREHEARPFLLVEETGLDGSNLVDISMIIARPGAPLEIRTRVRRSHLESLLPDIEELARECRFGPVPRQDVEGVSPQRGEVRRPRFVDIEVRNWSGSPVPGCVIWVIHMKETPWADSPELPETARVENFAHQRGRWYVTDKHGLARIQLRGDVSWACAASGDAFGAVEIASRRTLGVASICLMPEFGAIARVIDETRQPKPGVPVGLLLVRGDERTVYRVQRSSESDGTARWEDALRLPVQMEKTAEVYATIALPEAEPTRYRLWPDRPVEGEVKLLAPDTGHLVLSVFVLGEDADSSLLLEGLLDREPALKVRGADASVGIEWTGAPLEAFASWGEDRVFRSDLGLGLEVEVELFAAVDPIRVRGPVAAGELVELDVPVGFNSWPRRRVRVIGRLANAETWLDEIQGVFIVEGNPEESGGATWTSRSGAVLQNSEVQGFIWLAAETATLDARVAVLTEDGWVGVSPVPLGHRPEDDIDLGEFLPNDVEDGVAGRVMSEDGERVDGARCTLIHVVDGVETTVGVGTTRRGFFFIGGVRAGLAYRLKITATGHDDMVVSSPDGSKRLLDVRLMRS